MASQLCWGCLSGLRQPTPWMALSFSRCQPAIVGASLCLRTGTSSFHTSATLYANPVKKKSNVLDSMPKFRTTRSVRVKKKKVTDRPRPPAVGERKALRKRIVLSNTNALEVAGMQDLSLETMIDSKIQGSVLGLPVPMLDQLRAVQAFKPSQGWSIFRRPATVLRRESLELGRLFERISEGPDKGTIFRKVVTGLGGSGKSVHLLQAMAMGFLKKWVVITVPERKSFQKMCFPLPFFPTK
jgi:small subunit ribosomal protein S29